MSIKKTSYVFGAVCALMGASVAEAGTLAATAPLFAVEAFGPTSNNATAIAAPVATYSMSTTSGVYVAEAGKLYVYVRLTNGTFAAAPAAGTFTGTVVTSSLAGGGAGASPGVGTPVLSTDSTTVMVPISWKTASTLGVGATIIYTPAASTVVGVKNALGTSGGTVTMAVSLSTAPATTAPNSTAAQPADLEAAGTATIARSGTALTAVVSALPTYTGKIDLTASPAASNYSLAATPGTAVVAKLGSVTFTNTTGTAIAMQYDGVTPVDVTSAKTGTATPLQVTVTPGTGQSFPIGSVISLSTDSCVTSVGALPAFTSSTASTVATLVAPAANTVSGTAVEICLTKPSTGNTAAAITPTIAATLSQGAVAGTYGTTSVSGTGYALALNGSTVDIQTYWPGALTAFNFKGYLRVTNTGSLSAAVTAQNYTALGVLNTAQPAATIATLAPGESKILSTEAIDAIIGANPSGIDAGRVRITAPTNGLRVVSMLQAASGNLTEYPNVVNCTTSGVVAAVTGGGGTIGAVTGAFTNPSLTALSRVTTVDTNAVAINGGVATFGVNTALSAINTAASTLNIVTGGGGTVSTSCNNNSL